MDIELIHEPDKDNVVLDALNWKEKYQNERVVNVTQTLRAKFVRERNLNRRLKESYVNDRLAQLYFNELRHKRKVAGNPFKDGLLKWKQSRMYVLVSKLCIKVLEEVHDILMVGH
jgi:hypothetical protein